MKIIALLKKIRRINPNGREKSLSANSVTDLTPNPSPNGEGSLSVDGGDGFPRAALFEEDWASPHLPPNGGWGTSYPKRSGVVNGGGVCWDLTPVLSPSGEGSLSGDGCDGFPRQDKVWIHSGLASPHLGRRERGKIPLCQSRTSSQANESQKQSSNARRNFGAR
jgi:hypothetical protein